MKINETFLWKLLRQVVQPVITLQNLKKKKIYGVTYFGKEDITYQRSIRKNRLTKKRIRTIEKEIESFAFKPKISIVTPVYNVEEKWLKEAVESVFNQLYTNWELCIVDDASPAPHIQKVLEYYRVRDERVKVKFLKENLGISGASNEALALSVGEYVAFLDHDDCLSRDSLYEVVKLLNRDPHAALIYTDEDKLSMGGMRLRPVYKSGWNPDLFLSYNYLCHLVVCKRETIEQAGRFRPGFEGSQDYDLLLRITEITQDSHIHHIPRVLYHWRMIPGSAASVVDAKSSAFERARKALEDAMTRRGIQANVLNGELQGTFRIERI